MGTLECYSKKKWGGGVIRQTVGEVHEEDNLLVRGNNLLALHSLESRYARKVKLIYIDPPYNTGADSFQYNDSFNQATYLTFMKNRLDASRKLLSRSGVIMVQCSFHQFAHLKILMCDIFEKHLCDFNIQVRHPHRVLTGDKEYNDIIEYVLIFSNDKQGKMPFRMEPKTVDDYKLDVTIRSGEKPMDILNCSGRKVEVFGPEQYKVSDCIPSKDLLKKISIRGTIREKNSSGRFYVKHLEGLDFPPGTIFKVPNMGADRFDYRLFYSPHEGKKNGGYFQGMPTNTDHTKRHYPNFYNFEKEYNNVAEQGGVSFRNGKKPEQLLMFLIDLFTHEGDIVLDYHLGSGTTAAVAHKMGRKWIAVEQMDYVQDLAKTRMKKVIEGEQGGISKEVGWEGGGSFVYAELAASNSIFADRIGVANNTSTLQSIKIDMQKTGFLRYDVDMDAFDEEEFVNLSLSDAKRALMDCLDTNHLYINLNSLGDKHFAVSDQDSAINRAFYGISE